MKEIASFETKRLTAFECVAGEGSGVVQKDREIGESLSKTLRFSLVSPYLFLSACSSSLSPPYRSAFNGKSQIVLGNWNPCLNWVDQAREVTELRASMYSVLPDRRLLFTGLPMAVW